MNTKIAQEQLLCQSQTFNYISSEVSACSIILDSRIFDAISHNARQNISISKQDWDAHETSWDFQRNELLSIDADTCMENIDYEREKYFEETGEQICIDPAAPQLDSLAWRIEQYKTKWERKFMQLHKNEEELNRQFIDIYGLQDELTPDVPLDEITILQQGQISIEWAQSQVCLNYAERREIVRSKIRLSERRAKSRLSECRAKSIITNC